MRYWLPTVAAVASLFTGCNSGSPARDAEIVARLVNGIDAQGDRAELQGASPKVWAVLRHSAPCMHGDHVIEFVDDFFGARTFRVTYENTSLQFAFDVGRVYGSRARLITEVSLYDTENKEVQARFKACSGIAWVDAYYGESDAKAAK